MTVLEEGGHIAELFHKAAGINPLWTPPWPSIEPSTYSLDRHPEYGNDAESKLLAGIMGHNLCLDLFGAPSKEEAEAGLTVHGEAAVSKYQIDETNDTLMMRTRLEGAQLDFSRALTLDGETLRMAETVRNTGLYDRPIAWTQHVTLGPPFLEPGVTAFDIPGTKCRTGGGVDFDWPRQPAKGDMRTYWKQTPESSFAAVLLDPHREEGYFAAASKGLEISYLWKREDFPWVAIWDEHNSRKSAPWNGRTMTRGLEFGASPFPESRRKMIERRELFGVPAYRWIPAGAEVAVQYSATLRQLR